MARLFAFQCIFFSSEAELHTLVMLANEYKFESWIRVSPGLPTLRQIDLKVIAEGAGLRNLLLEWELVVAGVGVMSKKEAGCCCGVMLKNAKFGEFYNTTIQIMRLLT
ncbi:hypothetical protein FCV25MIE_04884 [Fagus crenata]